MPKTVPIESNLRRLMREKKITQRRLARRSGVSEQRICDILAGRSKGQYMFFTIYDLSRGLGVSVEELVGLEFATESSMRPILRGMKGLPLDEFLPLLKKYGYTDSQIDFIALIREKELDNSTLKAVTDILKLTPKRRRK